MKQSAFDMNEFMAPKEVPTPAPAETDAASADENETDASSADALTVHQEVVRELAADKAVQDEKITKLEEANANLEETNANLVSETAALKIRLAETEAKAVAAAAGAEQSVARAKALEEKVAVLEAKLAEQGEALAKVGDVLAKNTEGELSNRVALLDRDLEIADRFPGETRDHVIEVLREARDRAEKEGRLRRAQLLESVLVANEPSGELAKRRADLEKFFNSNGNIVSGPVIAHLQELGIAHKNGEEYLLPSEILARTY